MAEWESKRKLAVTRKYNKMIKKDDDTNYIKVQEIYSKEDDSYATENPGSSRDKNEAAPSQSFQPRER